MMTLVLAGCVTLGFASGCATEDKQLKKVSEAQKLYEQGVELYKSQKIDEGIEALRKAQQLNPEYVKLRYDLAKALFWRAEISERNFNIASAQANQLREEGKEAESASMLAKASDLDKRIRADYREALGHFLGVREAWPHDANICYFIARVQVSSDRLEEARSYFELCLELGKPSGELRSRIERAINLIDQELARRRLKR